MITCWPDRQTLQPVLRQSELDAVIAAGEIPVIAARGLFVVSGEAVVHAVAGIVDACEDAGSLPKMPRRFVPATTRAH